MTRNTCDKSIYSQSSCIVFSHISIEFGPLKPELAPFESADPENSILQPNTE